ncbi:MAG: flagellar biosynthetic protein FliR, partial [Nannocystaceae bacterium]
ALGLDRSVILALGESVNIQPLGLAEFRLFSPDQLIKLGNQMFRTGLQIALPIIGALFTLKLSIALLARVTPKIQLFVLSFTLTILMGHILLVMAMPTIGAAVASHLTEIADQVTRFALQTSDG